jgi:TRAP-type C4-dicarboxylate transport system substrate-binding protein
MRMRAFVTLAMLTAASAARAQGPVKIATLAPEGSAWMKLMNDWKGAIEQRTNGQVKLKFYGGGVAGDERDVVRKMRLGQMNGGALTAVGLGLIQPDVRVLELPFLIPDETMLDTVRNTLDKDFRQKFLDKGYVLLAWGDVGPTRLFTNVPLRTHADLAKIKMWVWSDDPLMKKLFEKQGVAGVPLGVPDVLPSLQTGLINACYGSPLAAVALQWHSKVRYVTSMIIGQSIGAIVLARKTWDAIGPEQQAAVLDESKKLSEGLTKLVRTDNAAALKKMQAQGIQVIETPPALIKEFETQGMAVRNELEGQLYSHDFRARVEKISAGK